MLAQIETPPVSWLGGSLTVRCKTQRTSSINAAFPSWTASLGLRMIRVPKQWRAPKKSALQSRVGDGFAPSSHARSFG